MAFKYLKRIEIVLKAPNKPDFVLQNKLLTFFGVATIYLCDIPVCLNWNEQPNILTLSCSR